MIFNYKNFGKSEMKGEVIVTVYDMTNLIREVIFRSNCSEIVGV